MTIFFSSKPNGTIAMSMSRPLLAMERAGWEVLGVLPMAGRREMAILRQKFGPVLPDGTLKLSPPRRTYLDTVARQVKAGPVLNDSSVFIVITKEERQLLDDVVSWSIVVEARAIPMAEMIRALIEDAKLQSTVIRAYRAPPPQRAAGSGARLYVQITSAQHKSLEVFATRLTEVAKRSVNLTETILALARARLAQLQREP